MNDLFRTRVQVQNRNNFFVNENSYSNFENRILQIHHHKTIENLKLIFR